MAEAPRHILFAAYQCARAANGGMESATRIFEALATEFRWTLLTNRETPRTARWRAGGARVLQFSYPEGACAVVRRLSLWRAGLQAMGVARDADILQANDIRALQLLQPGVRTGRAPLVFSLRDTLPEGVRYAPLWHRLTRQVDALVTLSQDMAQHVGTRLPVPSQRRHVIHSIVDMETFRPSPARAALRARLGLAPGELALGMVAGVSAKKRQLEVIGKLLPGLGDLPVRLHLIGDFAPQHDPHARACADAVVAMGQGGRVVFHGFRPDVADWLAALDLVLVASEREGLARCMIEAMACATPVISFNVASAHEMLADTGAGLVVAEGDWAAMGAAIATLAQDPARREAMGAAGRAAALARFGAPAVAGQWGRLYRELCTAQRRP